MNENQGRLDAIGVSSAASGGARIQGYPRTVPGPKGPGLMAAMLAAALWFVGAAAAQTTAPAVDKPAAQEATEAPAQPEVKPEAKPEAAKPEPKPEPEASPEPKPEPKAEAPAKPAAQPLGPAAPEAPPKAAKAETAAKPEAPKELTPCAKTFVPLADSYKKAYEELEKWTLDVDAQTAAAASGIEKIQEQIEKNEAAITKLRLQGGREGSAKARGLVKDNKALWSDLSAARKESSTLCAGFAREAAQKARRYQSDVAAKLEGVKARLK